MSGLSIPLEDLRASIRTSVRHHGDQQVGGLICTATRSELWRIGWAVDHRPLHRASSLLEVLAAIDSVPLVDVVQQVVARPAEPTGLQPRNDRRLRGWS